MKRREFVKTAALGTAAAVLAPRRTAAAETPAKSGEMPMRAYGKDGPKLSIIGFPGLVMKRLEQKEGNRLVAESVERGLNYFDVAPAYGDAEIKLGPALQPYRKKIFLACKTKMRDAAGAKLEFERSLKRLRTDRFDLYQLHVLSDVAKDVDPAFAKGGAMEYLIAQRKAGRIRYLGFSAHTESAALAAMDRFRFDSVLFPISFASWLKAGFGPKVVARARRQGAAVLGIKVLCRERWRRDDPLRKKYRWWYKPVHEPAEAKLAVGFALASGCVAGIPPAIPDIHRLALEVAPDVRPVTAAETAKLKTIAQKVEPLFPRRRRPA